MATGETPLMMVRRHIAEGEDHIARQLAIIERLRIQARSGGSESLLLEAEALLGQFEATQIAHVAQLRQIQEDQQAGLRDADGNLTIP
ncbi:MAG: hypothetical protein ACK4JY_13485 [Brevundimonas sp.]|uniref:hypothetical protein n=1 Tax=Brevundimonas sp. TaxID=1871086 RepID=UPI00391C8F4E